MMRVLADAPGGLELHLGVSVRGAGARTRDSRRQLTRQLYHSCRQAAHVDLLWMPAHAPARAAYVLACRRWRCRCRPCLRLPHACVPGVVVLCAVWCVLCAVCCARADVHADHHVPGRRRAAGQVDAALPQPAGVCVWVCARARAPSAASQRACRRVPVTHHTPFGVCTHLRVIVVVCVVVVPGLCVACRRAGRARGGVQTAPPGGELASPVRPAPLCPLYPPPTPDTHTHTQHHHHDHHTCGQLRGHGPVRGHHKWRRAVERAPPVGGHERLVEQCEGHVVAREHLAGQRPQRRAGHGLGDHLCWWFFYVGARPCECVRV
jgi:hypothetical protein